MKSNLLALALLIISNPAFALCTNTNASGFHQNATQFTVCQGQKDFIKKLEEVEGIKVTDFYVVNDNVMLSIAEKDDKTYMMISLNHNDTNQIVLNEHPSQILEQNSVKFKQIVLNRHNEYIYYRSSAWPESDSIRRVLLKSLFEVILNKNVPDKVKTEFVAAGKQFKVLDNGDLQVYQLGGDSHGRWVLMSPEGVRRLSYP